MMDFSLVFEKIAKKFQCVYRLDEATLAADVYLYGNEWSY